MTRAPVTSLLAAAGAGTRLEAGPPKGLRPLAGVPLFVHALRAFDACSDVDSHVLVLPRGAPAGIVPGSVGFRARVLVVEGGARRQDSVLAGLDAALKAMGAGSADAPRLVAVHDAARPFPDAALIARTIEGARAAGAAVPVLPVSDTVREVDAAGASLRVLDRRALCLAQTPQTARLDWLLEAYRGAQGRGATVTDEGSALEDAGRKIALVPGSPGNFKITTPGDLAMAEALLGAGAAPGASALRIGYGEDRHPRAKERPFVLAGVRLADEDGPTGHSDGDPLSHAVVDAILGAAGAGTIGEMFPDTDPRWAGARGTDLLAGAAQRVRALGWQVVNVDAVVVADAPRLAPRSGEIRRALASALEIGEERVMVKGKRAEGLGFEGTGAGVSCRAIALLTRTPSA
jgi:2-C-methyl-D-erythritol 4-phosphate cytidylyltransferase/2-C-methyl-D-erythritol 2,4-cyclodiphosphate synthase